MGLSIDKEALLEYVSKKKDSLFIGLLVIVILAGGWFLYQKSALSVNDILDEILRKEPPKGPGGAENTAVTSNEVVDNLLKKRAAEDYNLKRNPFGSPEDQMKKRQEVEAAYQRGVDLFQAGQFDAAIQQFDKVIALDVTETRISYSILPSEYKRRAQRENLKRNFDRVLASAKADVDEGNRQAQAGAIVEAQTVLTRADDTLRRCIDSDPEGAAIGKENIEQIKNLQLLAFDRLMQIKGQVLIGEFNRELGEARTALSGSNFIEMLKKVVALIKVQSDVKAIDPNAKLVSRDQVNQLNSLVEQIQAKVKDNFQALVAQADQQFTEGAVQKDMQKTSQAVYALQMARNFDPNDKDLAKKLTDYAARRADLVMEIATKFLADQQALLDKGEFEKFDLQNKRQLLGEVLALRNIALNAAQKNQASELENKLKALRLPPPVTDDFEVLSIQPPAGTSGGKYKIEVMDKTSRGTASKKLLYLSQGQTDPRSKIVLKQVDTSNGFVILSKSGYTDAKVEISPKK
ncbi:MAG: hypothetical protein AB1656_06325 [Candidatus Omnitrophota bacterium]